MGKLRFVAALVAGFGLLGAAAPAACDRPPVTVDVTVAVPMTCHGSTTEARTVTVSATLPTRVRAGRAYTVTHLTTDVPNAGAVTIATSAGQPATLAAGSGWSSTLQLAAGTAGTPITLQVTEAGYLLPGHFDESGQLSPGVEVHCTPAAPVTLGSIEVIGKGSGPATETTGIQATVGLDSRFSGVPFVGRSGFVAVTVPTELHPGDTFTLADLRFETQVLPTASRPLTVVDGAEPHVATWNSVNTVTAQPGETVELRLVSVTYDIFDTVTSTPIGSGHIASIPVVAR